MSQNDLVLSHSAVVLQRSKMGLNPIVTPLPLLIVPLSILNLLFLLGAKWIVAVWWRDVCSA